MKVSLGPCKGKEVNGEAIGQDLLSNMGWPFAELVAYASQDSVVRPGDVLGSGTCGSGCLAELWGRNGAKTPPPLKTGDSVGMTVDGIGSIFNTVGERRQAVTRVPARNRPGTKDRSSRKVRETVTNH